MTSAYSESTFVYHGLQTDTSSHLAETDQVKSLIKAFLENVKSNPDSPFIKDKELETSVWAYFKSLRLGEKTEKLVLRTLKLAVTLTHQAYTALPFKVKVLCASQFLYMFLADDAAEEFMEYLQSFSQNFVLNKTHHHPLLNAFDSHLRSLADYYGPYCHSAIIKSLFDYINGNIIEHQMEQSNFEFPSESRLMPMFLRTKVGGAEILIHLLWPKSLFPEEEYVMQYFPAIQELVLFTDFTNDILSYYKEFVLDNEKGNFVANFASTHHMQQLDVLRQLSSYTPLVINSVYTMFRDRPNLLLSTENFVRGWIMLCTAHRRYHLVELFADEQFLPPYDEDS